MFELSDIIKFSLVLAPIVLALVGLVKVTTEIPHRYLPLIATLVGIGLGWASYILTDMPLEPRLWAGALAGLSATGLFEVGQKSKEIYEEDIK